MQRSIQARLLDWCLSTQLMKLLVENAIQHGFSQSAAPAILQITIMNETSKQYPNACVISVKNAG
jgi:LytS/YehU family sensor histidine kinase